MQADKTIRDNVIEELDFEPSLHAEDIGVAVKNGVVTLSGFVPSYAEKYVAQRAAQRVKGVKAVAQDLTVRLPNDQKEDDDEIAQRVVNVLKWNVGSAPNLKVSVDGGWVTLSGHVGWNYQREEAARSVRRLTGVMGVNNSITVRPSVQPSAVQKSIERAFKRNAELESSGITVNVDGSTVTLKGKVKAWHERKMAEEAAWAIPGVSEVRDEITL